MAILYSIHKGTTRNSLADVEVFTPLTNGELSGRQSLTLTIQRLYVQGVPFGAFIDGNWTIHFQVAPTSGRVIPLSVAPVARHGVSVQSIRLDVAPNNAAFDGFRGGERLLVRISGLPAQMPLSEVTAFSTQISIPSLSQMGEAQMIDQLPISSLSISCRRM